MLTKLLSSSLKKKKVVNVYTKEYQVIIVRPATQIRVTLTPVFCFFGVFFYILSVYCLLYTARINVCACAFPNPLTPLHPPPPPKHTDIDSSTHVCKANTQNHKLAYTHTHTHTHTHMCMHACTHTHIHKSIYTAKKNLTTNLNTLS